jgi:hypothetical protein
MMDLAALFALALAVFVAVRGPGTSIRDRAGSRPR